MDKKQEPIEQVLTGYVIENANLKIRIAQLEEELEKKNTKKEGE